jgi:hypothetical protein
MSYKLIIFFPGGESALSSPPMGAHGIKLIYTNGYQKKKKKN